MFEGTVSLWTCNNPYVPISIVEGHEEGAVNDFAFVTYTSEAVSEVQKFNRRSSTGGVSPTTQFQFSSQHRRMSDMYETAASEQNHRASSVILSVGRDGQCLLQDFSLGTH